MARRKLPPPPTAPQSQSDSSDDSSSSDEVQIVTQRTPSIAKTPKPSERDDSDSDPEPPTKTINTRQKQPSESEDDSSSEDEDEDEEEPKLPAKKPESEPDKKKVKLSSAPSQPLLKKSSSAIQRIWSPEDEKTLVQALSDYQARNGNLPPKNEYALFLSTIRGSISFPATVGQVFNKICSMKHYCGQKENKGRKRKKVSDATSSNPNESSLFEMWTELFEGSNKASEKGGSPKIRATANGSVANAVIGNGVASYGGKASDGAGNGGDVAGSNFYLGELIKDMMQQCPRWFPSVEDVIARIGESKVRDLEAKAKTLRIDMMNLHVREKELKAELLESLADAMADD